MSASLNKVVITPSRLDAGGSMHGVARAFPPRDFDAEVTALTRRVRAQRGHRLINASGALCLVLLATMLYLGYDKIEEGRRAQEQYDTALAARGAQLDELVSEIDKRNTQIAEQSKQLIELRPALAAANEEIQKAKLACEQSEPAPAKPEPRAAEAGRVSAARTAAR